VVQAKAAQKDEIPKKKNPLALCSDCGVVNAFLKAVT
jgi:hypothetical protein